MKAIATKQPTNESVKQNKSGEKGRSRSVSPLSTGMPLLQRKCACGGGCPRCKEELGIQTKLKISEPGDKYEQEADRIADEVMRMPEPSLQRQVRLQKEDEEMVQSKVGDRVFPLDSKPESSEVPPIIHEVLNSPGQPLDPETRTFMESRFGHDFSQVRVHTDAKAAEAAQTIYATAYTVGQNIVFGKDRYVPGTQEGGRLLAHELTHTVQQRANAVSGSKMLQPHLPEPLLQRQVEPENDEETNSPKTEDIETEMAPKKMSWTLNNGRGAEQLIGNCGDIPKLPSPYFKKFFNDDGTELFCVNQSSITVSHTAEWSPGSWSGIPTFNAEARNISSTWKSPIQAWNINPKKPEVHSFKIPSPGSYWLNFTVNNNRDPKKRHKLIVSGEISEP